MDLLLGQGPPETEKLRMWRRYDASQNVQQMLKRGWGGCKHNTSNLQGSDRMKALLVMRLVTPRTDTV